MSSTLIEQIRSYHEEIEKLERSVIEELKTVPSSSKDRFLQGHRIRRMIDSIMLITKKLNEAYEDKDKSMEDEIAALAAHNFYDSLQEMREFHRNHPSSEPLPVDDDAKEKPVIDIAFSGEEGGGRYLDLHDMYNIYINSKFGEKVEYSAYLNVFSQLEKIPRKLKFSREYRNYVEALLDYMVYFLRRTDPLQDLDRIFSKVETDFDEGKVNELIPSQHNVVDLDYYNTVEDLIIDVGSEKLKEALGALGLKVGGTLEQRAERLFLTKHTPLEKLDKKHFAKLPQNGDTKEISLREAKVKKLCDLLDETIERTKQNVVKKQGMKYEEMDKERERDQELANEEMVIDEEEDKKDEIYNPLKLPMGVDEKPIPYWLYSLHGLKHEFKCEICGDHVYKGRREFEKHFKEVKHQNGMRSLGIPNNKNFNEITSINEARELWKKIQEREAVNKWKPEVEEEYEDRDGNVYSKKIYSDLQRQGLI